MPKFSIDIPEEKVTPKEGGLAKTWRMLTHPISETLGYNPALDKFAEAKSGDSKLGAQLRGFLTGATEAVTPGHVAAALAMAPELGAMFGGGAGLTGASSTLGLGGVPAVARTGFAASRPIQAMAGIGNAAMAGEGATKAIQDYNDPTKTKTDVALDLLNAGIGAHGAFGAARNIKAANTAANIANSTATTAKSSPSGLKIALEKLANAPAGPATAETIANHAAIAQELEKAKAGKIAQTIFGKGGVPPTPSIVDMEKGIDEAKNIRANELSSTKATTAAQKLAQDRQRELQMEQGMLAKAQKYANAQKLVREKAIQDRINQELIEARKSGTKPSEGPVRESIRSGNEGYTITHADEEGPTGGLGEGVTPSGSPKAPHTAPHKTKAAAVKAAQDANTLAVMNNQPPPYPNTHWDITGNKMEGFSVSPKAGVPPVTPTPPVTEPTNDLLKQGEDVINNTVKEQFAKPETQVKLAEMGLGPQAAGPVTPESITAAKEAAGAELEAAGAPVAKANDTAIATKARSKLKAIRGGKPQTAEDFNKAVEDNLAKNGVAPEVGQPPIEGTPEVGNPSPETTPPPPAEEPPPVAPVPTAPKPKGPKPAGRVHGDPRFSDEANAKLLELGPQYQTATGKAKRELGKQLQDIGRAEEARLAKEANTTTTQPVINPLVSDMEAEIAKTEDPLTRSILQRTLDRIKLMPPDTGGTTLSAFGAGQGSGAMNALRNNPQFAARLLTGAGGAYVGNQTDPLGNEPLSTVAGGTAGFFAPDLAKLAASGLTRGGVQAAPAVDKGIDFLNRFHNTALLSPFSVAKKALGDVGGLSLATAENPERAGEMLRQVMSRSGRSGIADAFREGFSGPENEAATGLENFIQNPKNPLSWSGKAMGGLTNATKHILGEANFSPEEQAYYTLTANPTTGAGKGLSALVNSSKVAKHVVPFSRIAINRLERAKEYSPLGLIDKRLLSGDPEIASKIVDKALLGSVAAGGAYGLTPDNYVKDHPMAASMIAAAGGPLGIPVLAGMAAKTVHKRNPDETVFNSAGDAMKAVSQDIPGLRLIEDSTTDPKGLLRNYLSGYTNVARPLALGLDKLNDVQTEPDVNSKDLSTSEKILNRALSNIPGIRGTLPTKPALSIFRAPKFTFEP